MRSFNRLVVCAAAAMVLSASMFHGADSWFGENASVLEVCRKLVREVQRGESLQARLKIVSRSQQIKCDSIAQLISGRLSFRQVILQFQKANELVNNVDLDLAPAYRLPTDTRKVGRQVFLWVRNTVATRPSDKVQRLLSDLEREYQTMFGGEKPDATARVQPMDRNRTGYTAANTVVW